MKTGWVLSRGLAIILVPIVFQIIFIGALAALLWTTYGEFVEQERFREIANEAHGVQREACDETIKAVIKKRLKEEYGPAKDRTLKFAKRIDDLSKRATHPRQKETLKRLKGVFDEAYQIIVRDEKEHSAGRTVPLADYEQSSRREQQRLMALFNSLVLDGDVSAPLLSPENRVKLAVLFAGAIAASVLTALLLARLYGRSIRDPLLQLRRNSELLSQQKPLLEPLRNKGEFTEVDELLHDLAASVQAAITRERELIENAGELICSLNAQGVFVSCNRYVETLLGRTAGSLVGAPLDVIVAAEDHNNVKTYLANGRDSSGAAQWDLRLVSANGNVIESRWSVLRGGADGALFGVVKDVTEEIRLRRMKEEFADLVSRELHSPLHTMSVLLNDAITHAAEQGNAKVQSELQQAHRNIATVERLVDDLVAFRSGSADEIALNVASSDVDELVQRACELVRHSAEAKRLRLVFARTGQVVPCDADKMTQALVNLLSNAIKFSPPDAAVSIDVSPMTNQIEIAVEDEGPGIPLDERERLFAEFEQGGTRAGGVGLGLSICKALVERHGGTVGVTDALHSTRGTGSRFFLRLPS